MCYNTGMELIILEETESTNTLALQMARDGAAAGTAILALRQTNGHGQFGRPWASDIGGMYLSVIFRSKNVPETIAIGEIVRAFLVELTQSHQFTIKPPNDILFQNRKICGILVESSTRGEDTFGAIGIGLNVNNTYPGGANLHEIIGTQDVIAIARELVGAVINRPQRKDS